MRRRSGKRVSCLTENREKVREMLADLTREDVCVAFSGGVDSSLLLKIALTEAKRHGQIME